MHPISLPQEHEAIRPRIGVVLGGVLLGTLYLVYLGSAISLMLTMWAGPPTLTAVHELPQSDFGLFWCAGKGLLTQAAARFGLSLDLPAYLQTCRINILSSAAPVSLMWPYPPPMGFLVAPFSFIPLATSFWIWRFISVFVAALLLRRAGLGWGVIIAGLGSTAALHDLVGGQNGTLIAGMLVPALLLAETRPGWAGALAGALIAKPQMALVFPSIALHPGRGQLLAIGVFTASAISLFSLIVWGPNSWVRFFEIADPDAFKAAALPFDVFFPAAGITIFSMARSFGAGVQSAWDWQAASSITALILVWVAWRPGTMASVPRMALTCALGVLAMPHGFAYDLVAFSIGIAALYACARGWEKLVLGLLWLMGGYTITLANETGLVLFPLMATAGAAMAWRLKIATSR